MKTVRTTVSLPSDHYDKLQALVEANGLSVAWVVRQAVDEFLDRVDSEKGYCPLDSTVEVGGKA